MPLGNSSSCELSIDEYPDWPYGGPTFLHGDFITIWDWGRVPRCLSLHPLLGVWGEIISPLLWSILFSSTTTLSKGDPIILGGYASGSDDDVDPDYSSAVYQRATGEHTLYMSHQTKNRPSISMVAQLRCCAPI